MTTEPWYTRCRLHIGDYRETLALCNGAADLVLTSPPYADARTYNMGCNWTMTDYAALGDAVFAALRPGGHALINIDAPVREWRRLCEPCGRMTREDVCPRCGNATVSGPTERGLHPWDLQDDWAERVGFRVPDRLAFGRQGLPGEYRGRFRNDWEPLLWLQKPGGDGYFDRSAVARTKAPYNRASVGRHHTKHGERYEKNRLAVSHAAIHGIVNRGTMWQYKNVTKGCTGAPDIEAENHPARWPYKLAEDIVRCFCPPDGLAVDPFVGAGTSAAAALEHGRRFIGGDLGTRPAHKEKGLDEAPWATVAFRVLHRRAEKLP